MGASQIVVLPAKSLRNQLLIAVQKQDATRVAGFKAWLALGYSLLIVLIAIGSSDLLFALDSIPAVFGVTEEAFIVFAAEAFAWLGLRAPYFLVTGLLDGLRPSATSSSGPCLS